MHSSMRWAHTLTCMRSRRWGREGSNGGFSQHSYTEAVPACTQTTLYYLHGGPLLALLVFCPAHTTPVTLSATSLLSPCCFNCCSLYSSCTWDFLSLPCEYREMLTIPHIFSSQTIAEGLHHKETRLLLD